MGGLEEIPVCRLCLEPIFYSICPECMYRNINLWMDRNVPYLEQEITEAHDDMTSTLETADNIELCIRCHETTSTVVCPYCYVREVYHRVRDIDPVSAERLAADFNFDFEGNGYDGDLQWSPIEFSIVHRDEGPCEACGNEDHLRETSTGGFQCSTCAEEAWTEGDNTHDYVA